MLFIVWVWVSVRKCKCSGQGPTQSGKSGLLNAVYNPNTSLSSGQKSRTHHPPLRNPQSLTFTHRKLIFKFVDAPGLSFIPAPPAAALPPSSTSDVEGEDEDENYELRRQTRVAHDILLRNRGSISRLNDPLPAAPYIFHRATLADLLILYNLPAVAEGILARREDALHRRGAVVDLVGARLLTLIRLRGMKPSPLLRRAEPFPHTHQYVR